MSKKTTSKQSVDILDQYADKFLAFKASIENKKPGRMDLGTAASIGRQYEDVFAGHILGVYGEDENQFIRAAYGEHRFLEQKFADVVQDIGNKKISTIEDYEKSKAKVTQVMDPDLAEFDDLLANSFAHKKGSVGFDY